MLDLDEPWKVVARNKNYLISPQRDYECIGDVPNVTFPCVSLYDKASGKVTIYYGCAETVTGLAFARIDGLLEFVKDPKSQV